MRLGAVRDILRTLPATPKANSRHAGRPLSPRIFLPLATS
jgi:hypothetical protein